MNPGNVAREVLQHFWGAAFSHSEIAKGSVSFTGGAEATVPSSFHIVPVAQAAIGAAALGASHIGTLRGLPPDSVTVDARHAVAECSALFAVNGTSGEVWDKLNGLYATKVDGGWVRAHTNFAHHRDGFVRLATGRVGDEFEPSTALDTKAAVQSVVDKGRWTADELEDAAATQGLVVAKLRSFDEWDATKAAQHVQQSELLDFSFSTVEGAGPAKPVLTQLPPLSSHQEGGDGDVRPLDGLRVLDLTRILAGPVGCKTLAAYGADVLMVNSPSLPNIDFVVESSQGKRSCLLDLKTDVDRATFAKLLREAHVIVQAYRPGSLESLGFGFREASAINPNIIYVSLSAYGNEGPWGNRRGFDSLVQTATGFNDAERKAAGCAEPRAFPFQALDYTSGFLIAAAVEGALARQLNRGGGAVHVKLSLARVGHFIRLLGQQTYDAAQGKAFVDALKTLPDEYFATHSSGFHGGCLLRACTHAARFERARTSPRLTSQPPGTHAAAW